jgi:hypothetical protein
MRRRVEDDTGTVEDVGLSIANAQDKDRTDAAAAALRLLSTFIILGFGLGRLNVRRAQNRLSC